MTWNGAGAWLIFSQSRQVNFSRTCWITFQDLGMTSSVSVTSSPSLDNRALPQQRQAVGPGTITRWRGRCSGKGRHRRGLGQRHLGSELIRSGRRLQLLELQLDLIENP